MAIAQAKRGMTAKDMEVGLPYSLPGGQVAIKFPDNKVVAYADKEVALHNYDQWLQEQQIQADVETVKRGTREFLSALPGGAIEAAATGISEARMGIGQMAQGARNLTSATSMAVPIIEGEFTSPRVTTPAMRALQGSAQLGAGILRTSSAPAAAGGEGIDQLTQATLTSLGMDPTRARQAGGVANIASQLALPGVVPKVPLGRLRNLPFISRLVGDSTDPVERAVRSTFIEEFGTKMPPRRMAFKFKENFGIELQKLDRARSDAVTAMIREAEESIPSNAFRDPSNTRDAVLNTLRPGAIRGVRGRSEREASVIRRSIRELSDTKAKELQELGIDSELIKALGEGEVDFFTLNQLRRDVGDALGSAKRARTLSRAEEAQLSDIYNAIRKDMNSFSDEFPQAVNQYNRGLQRFREEVVPLRRFTKPLEPSQIADRLLSAPPEHIRELRRTLTRDQARNLAAASFGSKMDTAFDADGVFNVGTFRQRIDTETHRRAMAELLEPQEFEAFKAMNDVLQQAAKDIALTSKIGAFMRPMALVHMVKGNLQTGGAFIIPEVLKQSGRAQGARRIIAAAKKQPFKPKFEAIRSVFATLEATRRQLAEERRFLAEASNQAVEPSGVERALGIVGQRRPAVAQPPQAGPRQ